MHKDMSIDELIQASEEVPRVVEDVPSDVEDKKASEVRYCGWWEVEWGGGGLSKYTVICFSYLYFLLFSFLQQAPWRLK